VLVAMLGLNRAAEAPLSKARFCRGNSEKRACQANMTRLGSFLLFGRNFTVARSKRKSATQTRIMPVRIRMKRVGAKNKPVFRIVGGGWTQGRGMQVHRRIGHVPAGKRATTSARFGPGEVLAEQGAQRGRQSPASSRRLPKPQRRRWRRRGRAGHARLSEYVVRVGTDRKL